jgi:hypothetical protein
VDPIAHYANTLMVTICYLAEKLQFLGELCDNLSKQLSACTPTAGDCGQFIAKE